MSHKTSGKALQRYMRAQGFRRQKQLALDLGLSEATICRYFRGSRSFSPKTAMRIRRHTGIPLEDLFQ